MVTYLLVRANLEYQLFKSSHFNYSHSSHTDLFAKLIFSVEDILHEKKIKRNRKRSKRKKVELRARWTRKK